MKYETKIKKWTIKQWKDEAWKWFSIYIRLYYCDKDGYNYCYTCGRRLFWKGEGMQAGHFGGGRGNAVLVDERQVRPQCLTKESNIRLFNGLHKSIKDVKVGDKLWGFNEKSLEKEVCIVENVDSFIPEVLYEIEMDNGDKFFATDDHMVVSNKKWVSIKDMLTDYATYDIMEI